MRSGRNTKTNITNVHRRSSVLLVGLLTLIAGNDLLSSSGLAGEFLFVAHDVEGDAAAWSPREVVIHKSTDLDGGLIFVLENPTPRTHVFEAPGLFEQIVEGPEAPIAKPLRVYVAPGETVHIRVSTEHLNSELETDVSGAQTCQFFCPLHGDEDALRSKIRVVP